MINEHIKRLIWGHAKESSNECCGYIFNAGTDLKIERKENLLNSPNAFAMQEPHNVPIAYYHSHLNSLEFSEEDKIVSEVLGLPAVLVNRETGAVNVYYPHGQKLPYDGRPFVLGYSDCLCLTRDYFKYSLNITLRSEFDYINQTNLSKDHKMLAIKSRFSDQFNEELQKIADNNPEQQDWLVKYFKWNGFREVDGPKKNDVLIIDDGQKTATHCCIYLGNNKILNHNMGKISGTEIYNRIYQKRTKCILRHSYYD